MPGVDTRGLAAHILVPQRWCVNVCYHFRVESHINLLEADELWSCGCAEERRACLHPHFGHAEATVRHCCAPLPCGASRLRSTGWAYSCVLQVWWRLLSCFGHYWCYGLHRLEDCGGEDQTARGLCRSASCLRCLWAALWLVLQIACQSVYVWAADARRGWVPTAWWMFPQKENRALDKLYCASGSGGPARGRTSTSSCRARLFVVAGDWPGHILQPSTR